MSKQEELDSKLSNRPELQELVDRNIIKDPTRFAPAIQKQVDDLARQHIEDSLRHKIDSRPTRDELVENNILKGNGSVDSTATDEAADSSVAPALQQSQAALEKSQLQDKMEHKIHDRPDPALLVEHGILKGNDVPQ
ncbi:hypothetical protein CLU79DRAFT_794727 [Phycomyces nitens]|nr:hypothetical protein CLU79DRAFT_794727 [Phycomyces nitens]